MRKPQVHLWLYNHPFCTISDQVCFAFIALRQYGYRVSVGRRPSLSSLNVVIENFSSQTRDVLVEFCKSSRKRVAVIMTEHVDFEHGQIFFHGAPLGSANDYMHPATMQARIRHLLECLPYIRCFLVLGDLPELRNISIMLPGLDVRAIPFPNVDRVAHRKTGNSAEIMNDFVFTGNMTAYRTQLLTRLQTIGLSVVYPQTLLSRKRRNTMNRTAKVILNIPQRSGWRWLSLMRIIAGLQTGRPTISLGTSDASRIASCCTQLDINTPDWISGVQQLVVDWKSLYLRDIENYAVMAKAFEQEYPFPHDVFEFWSVTDGLPVEVY